MTTFEKDYNAIKTDWTVAREILTKRKNEIKNLEKKLRATKNSFKAKCIRQEITRLKGQYKALDELV